MAYPLESLSPTASDADKQAAMQATVQQMISEGMSPDDAQQKAMDLMMQMQQPMSMGSMSAPPPTRNTLQGFASSGGGIGSGSSNEGYQGQTGLNRRFTNWNPVKIPPGRL